MRVELIPTAAAARIKIQDAQIVTHEIRPASRTQARFNVVETAKKPLCETFRQGLCPMVIDGVAVWPERNPEVRMQCIGQEEEPGQEPATVRRGMIGSKPPFPIGKEKQDCRRLEQWRRLPGDRQHRNKPLRIELEIFFRAVEAIGTVDRNEFIWKPQLLENESDDEVGAVARSVKANAVGRRVKRIVHIEFHRN